MIAARAGAGRTLPAMALLLLASAWPRLRGSALAAGAATPAAGASASPSAQAPPDRDAPKPRRSSSSARRRNRRQPASPKPPPDNAKELPARQVMTAAGQQGAGSRRRGFGARRRYPGRPRRPAPRGWSSISAASSASAAGRSPSTGAWCISGRRIKTRRCCCISIAPRCRRRRNTCRMWSRCGCWVRPRTRRARPMSGGDLTADSRRAHAGRRERAPTPDAGVMDAGERGCPGGAPSRSAQSLRRQYPDRFRALRRRLSDHPGLDRRGHRPRPQPRHPHGDGEPAPRRRAGGCGAQQDPRRLLQHRRLLPQRAALRHLAGAALRLSGGGAARLLELHAGPGDRRHQPGHRRPGGAGPAPRPQCPLRLDRQWRRRGAHGRLRLLSAGGLRLLSHGRADLAGAGRAPAARGHRRLGACPEGEGVGAGKATLEQGQGSRQAVQRPPAGDLRPARRPSSPSPMRRCCRWPAAR